MEKPQSEVKRMNVEYSFDYYYGAEAEQFVFYRIPKVLFTDKKFRDLSNDAKILYGLMLDRLGLSLKHGWFDGKNRAYIHYTLESIMEDLNCAREKCVKVLAELDSKKGIGLIEKKRQGLGKPDIIYVKNFMVAKGSGNVRNTEDSGDFSEVRKSNFRESENRTSGNSKIETLEVRESNHQKFENPTSGSSENETAEVRESNTNKNNKSDTELNKHNSIYHSDEQVQEDREMDVGAYIRLIRENIDYDELVECMEPEEAELYQELFGVICDVVCVKRKTVRIGGENYPYELVQSRFLKLNSSHLQYVMDCMHNTTTKITNIRAYMITALYNSVSTLSHYYQQEVQHDMYGGGWIEKGII